MKRALPFLIILIVLVGGFLLFRYLKTPQAQTDPPVGTSSPNASPVASAKTDRNAEPGADPPHMHGNPNAAVLLEEFGDFECPPCGALHPILKTMETEFGDKLTIVFREYPLVPAHPHALNAARAAEAAGLQGKCWEMHHMLYDNQETWHSAFDVRPIFEGYAGKIGLDVNQYNRDLSGEIVERRIFLDGKRGHSLGVTGTPTVFMNGREVPFESLAPDKLRELIKAELSK